MTTKAKKAGSKAGNQYGTFKVKYCSLNQARFIEKLLNERVHDMTINPNEVNIKHASRIIDELLKCPKRPEAIVPISEKQLSFLDLLLQSRQGAENYKSDYLRENKLVSVHELNKDQATTFINTLLTLPKIVKQIQVEVGAYRHNGVIYSVRKGRQSGNIHAFTFNQETKTWDYARGIVYELQPNERLTRIEAIAFGSLTGTCVHCGATLTQRKSVLNGMGAVCESKYN